MMMMMMTKTDLLQPAVCGVVSRTQYKQLGVHNSHDLSTEQRVIWWSVLPSQRRREFAVL